MKDINMVVLTEELNNEGCSIDVDSTIEGFVHMHEAYTNGLLKALICEGLTEAEAISTIMVSVQKAIDSYIENDMDEE
jgi:hypothetical protein